MATTTPTALQLVEQEIAELKETLQSLRMTINANQDKINYAEKQHREYTIRVKHLYEAANHLREVEKDAQ